MTIDFGELGYAYTLDLCAAIESYTARHTKQNAHAFHYRGLDLRYAVERQIYIKCVNSEALFSAYAESRGGSVPNAAGEMDPVEWDVAHGFPRAAPRPRASRFKLRHSRTLFPLRWLCSALRSSASARASAAPRRPPAHVPILFHVVHKKFASYLKPVVKHLSPRDYAYLISTDAELVPAFAELGEPFTMLPRRRVDWRSAFITPTLQPFMGLVEAANYTLTALGKIRPRCVVMVEGNAPLDSVMSEACRKLGIPSLCVQQGWSPVVHTGFRNLAFDEMFVWGAEFANLLMPLNPRQRFTVTGSPSLHGSRPDKDSTAPSPLAISFFLQSPCALLGGKGYEDFIELIQWCAATYPEAQFLVREHPSYPVPLALEAKLQMRNIRFSAPANENHADVIRSSRLVVSVFSTVLMEAVALGTVPLICGIGPLPRYEPDLAGAGAAIEAGSIREAKAVIDKVIREPEFLEPYKARLASTASHYFSGGDAALAISNRIREIAGLRHTKVISDHGQTTWHRKEYAP